MSEPEPRPGASSSAAAAGNAAAPPAAATPVKKRPGKRRRTRSHNSSSPSPGRGFFVPGFEAAEADGGGGGCSAKLKQMTLAELMDAAKGVTNMFLAHEIAVDKDFMLQQLKPEESDAQKRVKEIVHRAFWDILEEQLKEEPPVFTQALAVLEEIKEMITGLLLPQHAKLKESIDGRLDLVLIRQQAEAGVLDFDGYARYTLDVMVKLCAPVRDDEIAALQTKTEVVPLFKGILSTLEHMRLDMANFTLQQARPFIVSQSVEYEKTKFREFLATQEDGGLVVTKQWLARHGPPESEIDRKYERLLVQRVLTDAFVSLLEWDEFHALPETLVMDARRILSLRDAAERAAVSTAVILLAFSNVSAYVVPQHSQKLKETMKHHIDVLLEDFYDDVDLLQLLPNVAAQVVKDVNDYLAEQAKLPLPETAVKTLEEQICEMEDPNQRIRDLVQRRILEFCKAAICGSRTAPLQVPPCLTLCQRELGQIAGGFVRLVSYNRAVFGEFYADIIENHVLFRPEADGAAAAAANAGVEKKREA